MVIVSEIQTLASYQCGNMQQGTEVLSVFGYNSRDSYEYGVISPWVIQTKTSSSYAT
jgi:hypothetical protein